MFVLLACLSTLSGQSLSGTWCNTANAQDCVTIRQSGESLQANFVMNGRSTGEGVGWTRGNAITVAFRRLDNNDIATWTAEFDNAGRLAGRTANPNGTIRWTGAYAREGISSGNIDPTGSWQHVPGASWVITSLGNNRYQAQEKGLGEASGPAYFTSSGTFKIDYVTRDGAIKGYYEMRFANDNRTATGTVRELTGPQRSGASNWTRLGTTTPTPPTVYTGNIDPTGSWQHVPGASWVITSLGNNRYQAQEKGLGEASGPAYFTSSGTFKIDYVTRDGAIKGYYEMRFANDNRTATGTVRELTGPQRTGTSNWTRLSGGTNTNTGNTNINTGGEPWLPGSFDWVAGQFLVVHPQHRVTVYLNGSKINEGPWEYLGGNRFRFTMEKGGYVDTVELSPDGKYLTGRNNQGTELRGTRRVTSPRP